MLKKTLTAAVAAAVLSACPAQATETIDYRIGLNMAGTWSETVRADLDSSDADHDGTEEVAVRDTRTRFALTAVMPRVSLRDGRVVKPHYDVAQTSLTQETSSTTPTSTARPARARPKPRLRRAVARSRRSAAASCCGRRATPCSTSSARQPFARWSMSVDLLRVAGAKDVPELGRGAGGRGVRAAAAALR